MNLPRSAADVLADGVTMEFECIDRMYLNRYQPKLAWADGVAHFFRSHQVAVLGRRWDQDRG